MSKSDSVPVDAPQLDGAYIALTDFQAEGDDEYVVIENLGTVAQPLTNWVLASLRGERFFTLPDGTFLEPGAQLRVHSGSGAQGNPPHDLLWTRESVWNDKGDSAVLFGANGHEVARTGHGSTRAESQGAKLLYREGGAMRIEDSQPYKMVNRGWAAPDETATREERDER